MTKILSDEKKLAILQAIDPSTIRIPPGFKAYADAIEAAVLEAKRNQKPDGWIKQIRSPGSETTYDIVFCPIEGYAPFYIGYAAAGMMMVSKDRLRNVLALIDPPPIETDGKVMVFKNPNAADVLTRISAEVRAMIDTAEKEDIWRQG